jgi:hypothetical protein
MKPTTREIITTKLLDILETSMAHKVLRGKRSIIEKEFQTISDTDFPIIIVDVGLPQPEIKFSDKNYGVVDQAISELNVQLFCYLRVEETKLGQEDQVVSAFLSSLWKVVCHNPNIGDALMVIPTFSKSLTYDGPYTYFTTNLMVKYLNSRDSI